MQDNTRNLIAAIDYKDWNISVHDNSVGVPTVTVGHPVISINSGDLLKSFSIEAPLHIQNEGDICNHVIGLITSLEMHEIYENFLVNRVPILSPHRQVGTGFRTGGFPASNESTVHPHYLLGWKVMREFQRNEYRTRLNEEIRGCAKKG